MTSFWITWEKVRSQKTLACQNAIKMWTSLFLISFFFLIRMYDTVVEINELSETAVPIFYVSFNESSFPN